MSFCGLEDLHVDLGWDVQINEPDVSPLAIQGPNNLPLMVDLFGDWIKELKYFFFRESSN